MTYIFLHTDGIGNEPPAANQSRAEFHSITTTLWVSRRSPFFRENHDGLPPSPLLIGSPYLKLPLRASSHPSCSFAFVQSASHQSCH